MAISNASNVKKRSDKTSPLTQAEVDGNFQEVRNVINDATQLENDYDQYVNDNDQRVSNIEDGVYGVLEVPLSGSDVTLSGTQLNYTEFKLTGTLTTNVSVIVPTDERTYTIINEATGDFSVTVRTSAGSGVAVPKGQTFVVRCDGADVVRGVDSQRTIYVGSVAELEGMSLAEGVNVYLTEDGRAGEFVVKTGTPPSDPQKGIYIVLANGNYAERVGASSGVFKVEWFGVAGSGDETTKIQAAIDIAQGFGSLGGILVFNPKDYRYTSLNVTSRAALMGYKNATRLIKTSLTGDGVRVGFQVGRVFGVAITNIALAAEGTHTGGALLAVDNAGSFSAEDMTIGSKFPGTSFGGISLNNVSQSYLSDIVQSDGAGIGFAATDCLDIYMNDSRFDANGGSGVFIDTASGVYFSQVTAFNNTGVNFDINATVVSPVVADTNGFMFFTSCVGDTSAANNWEISNLRDSVFTGCWGSTQSGTNTSAHGFFVAGCQDLDFDSCKALNNNSDGMWILGSSSNINVTGGRYKGNGQEAGSTEQNGISIESGCSAKIESVSGRENLGAGLKIASGATSVELYQNDFTGNTVAPYDIAAFPTYFNESDNKTGQSLDVASASILNPPKIGDVFRVTGTTTINGINGQYQGRNLTLIFTDTVAVGDSGSTKLAGIFNATADDTLVLISDGTNWYEKSRSAN